MTQQTKINGQHRIPATLYFNVWYLDCFADTKNGSKFSAQRKIQETKWKKKIRNKLRIFLMVFTLIYKAKENFHLLYQQNTPTSKP